MQSTLDSTASGHGVAQQVVRMSLRPARYSPGTVAQRCMLSK